MAPRLAHTKSRAGCMRCKARKVKCDETKPICNNCGRHDAPCQYPRQHTRHVFTTTNERAPERADSTSTEPEPEPQIENLITPDERRHLELQLLHQFTSSVVWTLGSSSHADGREIWATTAIDLSFKYPFLLNSIFAFSALHLLKRAPTSRRFFAMEAEKEAATRALNRHFELDCPLPAGIVHRAYLDLALRQVQEAIKTVTPDSANALFLASLTLSNQGYPQFSDFFQNNKYEPPVRWLRMIAANRVIAQISIDMMPDKNLIQRINGDEGPNFSDHALLFDIENCRSFQDLLDWEAFPESPPFTADMMKTYEMFLAYVGSIYKSMIENEPPRVFFRRLICLAIMTPSDFITLIEERRPRALAILARFAAMTYALDDHWLWHGLAEQELVGIAGLLPDEWQWAMIWPRTMIEELKLRPAMED